MNKLYFPELSVFSGQNSVFIPPTVPGHLEGCLLRDPSLIFDVMATAPLSDPQRRGFHDGTGAPAPPCNLIAHPVCPPNGH